MRRIAEIYSKGNLIYKEVPEFKLELDKIADFLLRFKRKELI